MLPQELSPWARSPVFFRGKSSPLQQSAHILHDKLSSAQTSVFHQKLFAQEICVQPFPSSGAACDMKKGVRKSGAFLKAADKRWGRVSGWSLNLDKLRLKIRHNCWAVTSTIAAAKLGARGILCLQLSQGEERPFLQKRCYKVAHKQCPRVTSIPIGAWGHQQQRGWFPPVLRRGDRVLRDGTATAVSAMAPTFTTSLCPSSAGHIYLQQC